MGTVHSDPFACNPRIVGPAYRSPRPRDVVSGYSAAKHTLAADALGCKYRDLVIGLVAEVAPSICPLTAPGAGEHVAVIPSGSDTTCYQPSRAAPQPDTLVFNGANADDMHFFVTETMPVIHVQRAAVRLHVMGRHDGFDVADHAGHPALHLTGFLDDLVWLWWVEVPHRRVSQT